MIWQDLIIFLGQIALNIALIPTLHSRTHKPPLATSLVHGSVLAVFAVTFASLHFWLSTSMVGLESVLWLWIASHHKRVGRL